jgi:hypothetical protein
MRFALITSICLLLLGPISAEDHSVVGHNRNDVLVLQPGDNASVMGHDNNIAVEGRGERVSVSGHGNVVRVDGTFGLVQVVGHRNEVVIIERDGRARPRVEELGRHNLVRYEKVQ